MEPEQDKDHRIALWPGRRRGDGDNHPYLTGRLTIDDRDYFVTLWKRKRETDKQPILSGQIKLIQDEVLDV